MQNLTFPVLRGTPGVVCTRKNEKLNKNITAPINNSQNLLPQKVFAKHLQASGISFKGLNIPRAIEDYKWFINADRTPPFDAFMKIIADPKSMEAVFKTILKDDDLSYQLIGDLTHNPRTLDSNCRLLAEKIGPSSDSLMMFSPTSDYNVAFTKFMDRKVSESRSIEALLKLRPDWKEEVLLDKFKQLRGHDRFEIGNIPKEFHDGAFEVVIDYLKSFSQRGFKSETKIPELQVGNKLFNFEFFTEGKTDKNVFGVYTQGKKFVIKTADEKNKSLNNPFSLGVLALIDNYSTLNRCRNSAPIYYYNHNLNSSVYKFIEHNQVNYKISSGYEVNLKMPDFKQLGLSYNDTLGSDNYFVLEKNIIGEGNDFYDEGLSLGKEFMSVDNDHVTYYKQFVPKVENYNRELPNAMNNTF